jgi:hypothetical protein
METSTAPPKINYPTHIDARHQGPKVTVAAALCLCFAGAVLATRLLIRWPWRRLFGLDDGAAIVASVRILEIDLAVKILTPIVGLCSGSMDGDFQCCVARARHSV